MSDKLRGYAHRVDIAADVDRVWQALTMREHLTRWCSPRADIRAKPGGLFRASVDRVIELEAHIDVFEPARRLRLIYLPSKELPPAESAIIDDFILDPTEPGTIVRLLGSGIPSTPDWEPQYKRLRLGWQAAMTRMKVFVERQMRESEGERAPVMGSPHAGTGWPGTAATPGLREAGDAQRIGRPGGGASRDGIISRQDATRPGTAIGKPGATKRRNEKPT